MALRISDLGTAPTVEETDLVEIAEVDGESPSGYSSYKTTILGIANKIATSTIFSGLVTTAKNIVGAINEVNGLLDLKESKADMEDDVTEILEDLSDDITVTGNPVTFETINGGMANSCEVTFSPIQSGTGDPSPTNIRPISGWDSVDLVVSDGESEGETHTATFPDTVYGGVWKATEGKLVIDYVCVDLGTVDWTKSSATNGNVFWHSFSDRYRIIGNLYQFICSQYKNAQVSRNYLVDNEIGLYNTTNTERICILDTAYNDSTAAEFKTAMSGVQLCYQLATPTEITLTAEQIELLKGTNVVSTDGDGLKLVATKLANVPDLLTYIQSLEARIKALEEA